MNKNRLNLLKNSYKNEAIQGKISKIIMENSGNIKAALELKL